MQSRSGHDEANEQDTVDAITCSKSQSMSSIPKRRPPRMSKWMKQELLMVSILCFGWILTGVQGFQQPSPATYRVLPKNRAHRSRCKPLFVVPEVVHGTSQFLASVADVAKSFEVPFGELGSQLARSLNIGGGLVENTGKIPEIETTLVLESIGYDLLVFLTASVIVTPLAKKLNITPILGYLVVGAILGPNSLDLFANSRADVELGDIGILFLLFSEGLEVSSERLRKLANYLPLGLAQISLVTAAISAAFVTGGPALLGQLIPLQPEVMEIRQPAEVLVLALAGCLSTSAFIFPVLKERGWEEEDAGQAATSILLLQDLFVAPLLVLLPFLAGQSADVTAILFLTAKATLGFGSVLALGAFVLRRLFNLVAQTQSSETFVALCLLVSAGMGSIARSLGLTDTAGAFAAGVLLANTNYRAQIQADILPFKGILLGIFFMEAGSNFDLNLVQSEWPTVLAGAISLIVLKATTLGLATRVPRAVEPNRLRGADAIRVSLLLSGGGEFAFVVLATADRLGVIPSDLSGLLTAIILITMALTPILGEIAADLSQPLALSAEESEEVSPRGSAEITSPSVANDSVVVCGYGEIGRNVLNVLGKERGELMVKSPVGDKLPNIVAFDTKLLSTEYDKACNNTIVLYGDGANADVIRSSGITNPSAIFISYEDHGRVLSATARLRAVFSSAPIYARAANNLEVESLTMAGATEVVVESDELPRASSALIRGVWAGNLASEFCPQNNPKEFMDIVSYIAGISLSEVEDLLGVYRSMDQDNSGLVKGDEILAMLEKSDYWIANDAEIEELEEWLRVYLAGSTTLDEIELCRLYGRAPVSVKKAFGLSSSRQLLG